MKVRLAALQALQAASFSVVAFESCRGDYIATLREVADRSGSGAPSARARPARAREGRLRAEEAARRVARTRKRRWSRPRRRCNSSATTCTRKPIRWRARSSASHRTPTPSGRPCGCSRRMPPPRRCSRRSCATKTNRARSGRSRPPRCRRSSQRNCRRTRARSLLDTSEYDDIQATSLTALTQFGDDDSGRQRRGAAEARRSLERRQGVDEGQTECSPVPQQVRPVRR